MDKRFAHKTALVTGAGTGIGRAVAQRFAQEGAEVLILGRTEATLQETAAANDNITYSVADLEKEADLDRIVAEIKQRYGKLDILVNNAGIQRRHPCTEFPIEDWDLMLQVHLRATFLMCQAFGKRMIARGGGKIINVASLLAFSGGYTIPAYAAAKGGIAQLTKALANEWAEKNVNVNAIAPGYFDTDMNTALQQNPVRNSQILDRIPAKRYGDPDEIGGMTVFLASPAASYVHGSVMIVDGGWMAR